MDNNGNDYQGLSEESSKISSILHPYTLPRFEFDDTLQGHLRFDSLVENEVFLGISSQEHHHWIEDFPRGSSGIEFVSSAAESCSIPRCVNVWSEAASSESVEMLLKSVGQEEMVKGDSFIEQSDACDELGTLAKQMELTLRQGESNSQVGRSCDDENRPKLGTSPNMSMSYSIQGTLVVPEVQNDSNFSSEYIIKDVEFLNDQDKASARLLENLSNKSEGTHQSGEEESAPKNESTLNNASPIRSPAELQAPEIQLHVAAKIDTVQNFEQITCSPGKESAIPTTNGNSQDLHSDYQSSQSSAGLVLPDKLQTEEIFTDNCEKSAKDSHDCDSICMQAAVSSEVEAHGAKIDSEQAKASLLQTPHSESRSVEVNVSCLGSHSPVDNEASVTSSAEQVSGVDSKLRNQVIKGQVNSDGGLPILTDAPCYAEHDAEQVTENPKENTIVAGAPEETVLPSDVPKSVETSPSDKSDAEPVGLCNDADRLTCSSLDEEVKEKVEEVNSLELEKPSRTDTVSKVGLIDSAIASCETSCNIPVLPAIGASADEVTDQNEKLKLHSDVEKSMLIDERADMGAEVILEENTPDLKDCSQIENEAGPISLAENIAHNDVSVEVLIRDDQCLPALNTLNTAVQDKTLVVHRHESSGKTLVFDQKTSHESSDELVVVDLKTSHESTDKMLVVDQKTSQESTDMMDVDSVPCDSNPGKADDVEAEGDMKKVEKEIENISVAGNSEVSGGQSFPEAVKSSQGSAHVLSCSNLPETKESGQEDLVEAAIGNISGSTCEASGKVVPMAEGAGTGDGSREERSFTFDISPLAGPSEGESVMGWQSFPNVEACKMSMAELGAGSASSGRPKDHKVVQELCQVTSKVPEGGSAPGGPKRTSESKAKVPEGGSASRGAKSTSERKTRRGSGKSSKDNAKKGSNVKQPEQEDKSCMLASPSGPGQLLQFDVESTESGSKATAVSIPTSNLPDLNTSVPTSALFHQPFTDLQQVQLRAQIFVYGSLIQGAAPDEACMVSAFGTSAGGRNSWEASWRACVDRLHGQKTVASVETPVQSRSGVKAQDQSSKQGPPQSKVVPSPASRMSCKGTPSIAVNPMIPLSSPLWNLATPSCDGLPASNMARAAVTQPHPPLLSYQTTPMQTFGGHTSSWLSPAPFPGPWISSPQSSAFDVSARLSSLPSTETVKLTPSKDSSASKPAPSTPVAQVSGSSDLAWDPSIQKITSSHVQHSIESKSRKRKKGDVTEESQNSLSATSTGTVSNPVVSHSSKKGPFARGVGSISSSLAATPIIGGHFSTSVAVTASPVLSIGPLQRGELIMEKSSVSAYAGDLKKVEEAKLAGEEAAAHAVAAVTHCQSVWSELEKHRNIELTPDARAQLSSSAAAAVAAAASVAKAAAAAAKIASSAAIHFHQMANEVLNGNDVPSQRSPNPMSNTTNNLGSATPESILKGGDGNDGPNLIITTAREAARRKVEAASAASRHAENLDAILKAAELAAEAVSQAGKVVAMGEPLPLAALVEAGPERYWKGSPQLVKCSTGKEGKRNSESSDEVCKQSEGPSDQETRSTIHGRSLLSREVTGTVVDSIRVEEGISASLGIGEDFRGQSDCTEADNISVQDAHRNGMKSSKDNFIKENSLVEVFKDGENFKGAWYSANVLSLTGGKAFVCYTDLQWSEGPLKEWVPLEGEDNEAPIIRIPHPMSSLHSEGTRKRRRAAISDYHWSCGDRVDAWIGDCWREGVVIEKDKNDATMLTVHSPAQGETVVIKAWDLRPTVVWKNGEWIELPTSRQNVSCQGDTPQEKRQRLGTPANEVKEKGPKIRDDADLGKVHEPKLLPLSSTEKQFNLGSTKDGNKADGPRVMRSGLQKEGPKVIFGVPKPGKKRKFMDVSKHYVSGGSTKNDVSNDSLKSSTYLAPQGTGPRGWKNSSKVDVKEKLIADSSKLKAPKSSKVPGVSSKALPKKENSSVSVPHETTTSRSQLDKDSASNNVEEVARSNLSECGSRSSNDGAVDVPVSNKALPPDRNKKESGNAKSEQLIKGKLAVAGVRSAKGALDQKPVPDASAPRRSNRRIQPTSRLLEGLQSSLIISKIPSASHDRSQKGPNKGASKGASNQG